MQYDDTDGDAWIGICSQAIWRGDAAMEKKASHACSKAASSPRHRGDERVDAARHAGERLS
ncbi:MAG: hypothetical protein IPP94_17845 [Ignavibacteria bacterium]|nr:hypothetical protein [Ignavibacteria bacterium]